MKPNGAHVTTIGIWADSARRAPSMLCRESGCRARLWFVETVKNGKRIPLHEEAVALRSENDPASHREIWFIDAASVHFGNCAGAAQFRRTR